MKPVPLVAPDPDSALFLMQQTLDESGQVLADGLICSWPGVKMGLRIDFWRPFSLGSLHKCLGRHWNPRLASSEQL